jgi:hypothetical protein
MKTFTRTVSAALVATSMLFSGPLLANEPADASVSAAEVAAEEVAKPALWKVADEDTTIYLFGTVHALPEGVEWYTGPVADAFNSSETLVTEIVMDDTMPAKMQQLVMSKGVLPQGTTLRSLLDEEQKATFEEAMTKLGLPVAAFDQFEPWYAGMMLTMLPLMQQGYSPDSGVDKTLIGHAGDKAQQGLETIEGQIGMFDEMPQDSQIAFLVETAEGIDEIKPMLDKMVAEWLAGDADDLAVLMNEGLTDPVLAQTLLYSRNTVWADWIDTRLDEPGTVFIAVGAGHLAGDKSVQHFLVDHDLEVIRVQ